MSETCPLGICDGSGFVTDEATNTDAPCRCRPIKVAQAKARRLEARIPRRYRDVALERAPIVDFPAPVRAELRRYVSHIEDNLAEGRGIWFVGDVGTGKTAAAMLVSKTALDLGRSVAIYSLPRLLNLLRDNIDAAEGRLDLLDRLASVDLLHLDDLGAEAIKEQRAGGGADDRDDARRRREREAEQRARSPLRPNSWAMEQIYSVVNTRYEDQRALVVTTNLQADALAEQIGARTVSRIIEMCGDPLPFFGHDRRREYRDLRSTA